jgi:hypothetical protein
MGYLPADRDLVAHLYRDHAWPPLPYIQFRAAHAQHDAEHHWGVPPPEPGGPWSIYLGSEVSPQW